MKPTNIAAEIKAIRATLGISQKELADMLSEPESPMTRSRIADYETNRSRISAEDWLKIQGLVKKRKRAA